jgi:GDP-L-fucose synthase
MQKSDKIYIAGHLGMVGSAIHRNLAAKGYNNFIVKSLDELDLTRQEAVEEFFRAEKPDYVFDAAAKVGGIVANNTYRAQFIYENLMIQNNIIHSAYKFGTKKLLFLGSSCIYPKNAPQPMKENALLTGVLEQTNEPYAIAKIAGIKMCENYYRQYGSNFISVMPTNLYGPNDNYDLEKSHVLPALIRKMHLGKCLMSGNWDALKKDLNQKPIEGISGNVPENDIITILSKYGIIKNPENSVSVTLWGTGNVYREFLHVEDMADACVYIMEKIEASTLYKDLGETHINIGTGIDQTIKELAELVKEITGFSGNILWDSLKPDGTFKKQLDVSLLQSLNWNPAIKLRNGIERVYNNYVS